jgi:hypothetical protein
MLPAGTNLFSYSMLLCVTMRAMTGSPALSTSDMVGHNWNDGCAPRREGKPWPQ